MLYDREIADRVRAALAGLPDVAEQPMFGTLAFMVGGTMAVAAAPDGLLVRVGEAAMDEALAHPQVREARMGERVMKGWVLVGRDADLEAWVARGLSRPS